MERESVNQRGGSRIAVRVIVPLALLACAGAVIAIVSDTMLASEDDPGAEDRPAQVERADGGGGGKKKDRPAEYVVKEGDTLTQIAEDTGVPIQRIQRLNPDLDPVVLNAGQVIKLRR